MGASFSIRSSSKLESISPHRGLFAETPLKLLETRRLGVAAVVNSSVADVCKFLWLAVGHARNLVEWFSGHSLRRAELGSVCRATQIAPLTCKAPQDAILKLVGRSSFREEIWSLGAYTCNSAESRGGCANRRDAGDSRGADRHGFAGRWSRSD